MRFTIYARTSPTGPVFFDRELSEILAAIEGEERHLREWNTYDPVAVCEADGEIEYTPALSNSHSSLVLDQAGKRIEFSARQVLAGEGGEAVTILWTQE